MWNIKLNWIGCMQFWIFLRALFFFSFLTRAPLPQCSCSSCSFYAVFYVLLLYLISSEFIDIMLVWRWFRFFFVRLQKNIIKVAWVDDEGFHFIDDKSNWNFLFFLTTVDSRLLLRVCRLSLKSFDVWWNTLNSLRWMDDGRFIHIKGTWLSSETCRCWFFCSLFIFEWMQDKSRLAFSVFVVARLMVMS